MDSILSRFVLNALTEALVMAIIIYGIIAFNAPETSVDVVAAMRAFAMVFAFSFGVGVLNCVLFSMVPVWQQIWNIINRPLFLISGIFFVIDKLPPKVREILLYNPVVHMVMEMRVAIYPSYKGAYISEAYVYAVSGICTLLGLLFLRRYHRVLLDEGA